MRAGHSYYEILDVSREAGADDVRRAYRRLLRTCHPDLGGSPALFALVDEAFAVLSDSVQRARYDDGPAGPSAGALRTETEVGETPTVAEPARRAQGTTPGTQVASHGSDGYASSRRGRSSIWRPQPGTTYGPEPAPGTRPVARYL